MKARIAAIGGSGLYEIPGVKGAREVRIKTPFGPHSRPLMVGELAGVPCAFLPRHGKGHVYLPSEIPARANIYALKALGVERIVSFGAVGSLKEEFSPRHFVFPDQLVDRTKGRVSTFFGEGVVAHVAFAEPFCAALRRLLARSAAGLGITAHSGGAYVCMEGPAFSTKAESENHRRMGCSVVGMTAVPEAKLAREAEMCYAVAALVTDYDCWKDGEEVSTQKVVENLSANAANAQKLLAAALPELNSLLRDCACGEALKGAIFTSPKSLNRRTAAKLKLLIGHRLP